MPNYIHYALRGKWGEEQNYFISEHWRWFYRLKAALCLLLNLEPPKGTFVSFHVFVTYTDSGTSYSPGEPTEYWFEAIVVGYGVFSNWWATVYQDGT